ncbi:PAS domain S-box protein [Pedobacter rhodius]|uniref:histidine kinase n=1 Tax=Pedobacter rhodius TaxID=3004098 RepID=A0ABT4KWX3_9SPHI|nr:PAS domain S-box protein [Pedobacter sp. SJ11]MCZ4223436.1 PAS domain S-box protein [Pedobacter sp. SJ11]
MSIPLFSFSQNQLNRLFPFYIVINKDLIIESCGSNFEKLNLNLINKPFFECFIIDESNNNLTDFTSLKSYNGQLLDIKSIDNTNLLFDGDFEFLDSTSTFIFAGIGSKDLEIINAEKQILRKQTDQLLILSQIAEVNTNTVIITDNLDRITWVNQSFTTMTGYSFDEVLGKKPEHLLNGPNTSRETLDYLNDCVSNGRPFNADIYNYSKSGNPYWARIKGQAIHNQRGELTGFFALIEDITNEKEAQERLKESENRFRTALEKIGNVWEHDFTTGKTFFSKTNNEFWGYNEHELEQSESNWWDSVHKDDFHLLVTNFKKYKRGRIDTHNEEYRIIHKNNDIKWVLDRGVVIEKDERGRPLRVIGTHTDITPTKRTEEELEQRVKVFKSLSENIPGVIYEYEYREDGTDGLRYISPAIERVFGMTADEFWNQKYIAPKDQERINLKQKHSRDTLEPFYDESEITIPGLSTRWYAVHSSYSYTDQNNSKVFSGFMADITERKSIEESLRINEEKYRSILANMKLGLLEVDNDDVITYANNSFCHMSGYSMPELIGKKSKDLFYFDRKPGNDADKKKHHESGLADAYEVETRDKSGDIKWWLISEGPRYNDKAELVGSIGIHLDITEQKNQETELVEARIEAEQSAHSKEIFLANMSHEIRTPMNAIMSMANQLAKTNLEPQQEFYLETIHTASKSLLVIINDVLDLSKIDAGKLSLENIGFNLIDVLQNAMQVITHKGEEKGLDLNNFYFDGNIAQVLIGDPYRLNQVLLNLMTNAVKFTEKGSVDLNCRVIADKPNSQVIHISVVDTGIGMERAFVKHLFDKFSQEHESVSRKYGGTGLGMSICKELIEQMGGEIFVESKKGVGSTISFVLELQKGASVDMPEKEETAFSENFLVGKKILVTDDNDLNRLVASILLLDYGATVMVAENGETALEMITKENFDVVLMDIQMPVMNGFETTKKLRSLGNNIPIIALTASAIKGEREKCIDAGMNDYITKPINEEEFLKTIDKWIVNDSKIQSDTIEMEHLVEENEALYDLSGLRTISKGREAFVKKMVDIFCEQTPLTVEEMIDAYHSDDLVQMGAIAHKLKSNIDNLSIVSLQKIIRDIEANGKEKINDSSLPHQLKQVQTTISNVVEKLRKEFPEEDLSL